MSRVTVEILCTKLGNKFRGSTAVTVKEFQMGCVFCGGGWLVWLGCSLPVVDILDY